LRLPNLPYIKSKDARLYETIKAVQDQAATIQQQTNSNATGPVDPPPAIAGVHVSTGPGGEFQVSITDTGEISRGVNYFAEHADNPHFSNPHVIDMGQSRNLSVHMGSQKLYWRAYSSYSGSMPSAPAYHGSAAAPLAVLGGVPGIRSQSQGSGTGAPGQGLQGPGPVQQRTKASGFDWKARSGTQS
jgi:hypothetical protein